MSIFCATCLAQMPKISLPTSPKVQANKSLHSQLEFFKKLYDDHENVEIFTTQQSGKKVTKMHHTELIGNFFF